ncbi:MAG: phosphoribosyltransferase family protein [Ignisphaera sp.]|uniref:Phosphoribosyltransferase domain-containing protein n=1 Tax=Ignisphaera aggregans TaxID=334771 RepID=A0A7C4D2Y4_9CREN
MSESIEYSGLVVELLSSLKRFLKFKELENILEISIPTLWRYIHGDIKPTEDRAKNMLMKLLSKPVIDIVMSRIVKMVDSDVVNLYSIVYNIDVLTLASIDALLWSKDLGLTAVVTVEVDGISLATMIAKRLGTKLIVIKRRKEVGFDKFIELSYVTSMPPEVVTLYLPEGVLGYGDRVLVVDDLVRSGRTSGAVCELVKKSGAKAVGFYALTSIGNTWKKIVSQYVGEHYKSLFELKAPNEV